MWLLSWRPLTGGAPALVAVGVGVDHLTRRVAVDTYSHRYECRCGWVSDDCANGEPAAGAALVRHIIDTMRRGGEE